MVHPVNTKAKMLFTRHILETGISQIAGNVYVGQLSNAITLQTVTKSTNSPVALNTNWGIGIKTSANCFYSSPVHVRTYLYRFLSLVKVGAKKIVRAEQRC